MSVASIIASPDRLWSRAEVLGRDSPVPREAGLYAWYFKVVPPGVPVDSCTTVEGKTLLYSEISPKAPPKNGKPPSKENLWKRVRYHLRGNAEGSTLRLTLGVLLGIELRRVGSGKRMTFGHDEETLSNWLEENAFVMWITHPKPWELETEVINTYSLPLNLDQNTAHPFHPILSQLRREAKQTANNKPILDHT